MCPSYQILLRKCSGHYASLSATFSHTALQMKNSRRLQEVSQQQSSHHKNMTIRVPSTINYCLKSAAARFQLCSACYKASQTRNGVRIVSAINPVTMENTDESHLQTYCREAIHRATMNRHLWLSAKRNMGHKGKSMVHPLYVLRYAKRYVSG